MNLPTLTLLFFHLTPITAISSARVWTHFYPNCPGEPYTDLESYEHHDQVSHEFDIQAGTCQGISVQALEDRRLQYVDHVSVDAELFWTEPFDQCNITVHEIPHCMDPPLIRKEIHNRVGVSECNERRFAPFNEIWVRLECGEVGGPHPYAEYLRPPPHVQGHGQGHGSLRNVTMGRVGSVGGVSHSRPLEKPKKRWSKLNLPEPVGRKWVG
ncbi:hypothetical protein SI65_05229 [Aspergillus cristatus]|uniref:Uncharacterized protein n=1 Tax=Aspergillus cristatus TaxID=573508 RepID=A0A1E3BCC0_ASPCR|nr:hypothetical protein SI65_05229 [Aspergillus cristatus]